VNDGAFRYYTADSPMTGAPWAVFRVSHGGPTAVYDLATDDWVVSGWPLKYLTGADLNYSALDPADVDGAIAGLKGREGIRK
jgi:hypothetical protein